MKMKRKIISIGILAIFMMATFGINGFIIKNVESKEAIPIKSTTVSSGNPDYVATIEKCTWDEETKIVYIEYHAINWGDDWNPESGVTWYCQLEIDGLMVHEVKSVTYHCPNGFGFGYSSKCYAFNEKPSEAKWTIDIYNDVEESNENNNCVTITVSDKSDRLLASSVIGTGLALL